MNTYIQQREQFVLAATQAASVGSAQLRQQWNVRHWNATATHCHFVCVCFAPISKTANCVRATAIWARSHSLTLSLSHTLSSHNATLSARLVALSLASFCVCKHTKEITKHCNFCFCFWAWARTVSSESFSSTLGNPNSCLSLCRRVVQLEHAVVWLFLCASVCARVCVFHCQPPHSWQRRQRRRRCCQNAGWDRVPKFPKPTFLLYQRER